MSNKTPLRFPFLVLAEIRGHSVQLEVDLTYHPGSSSSERYSGTPGYAEIHSASSVDDEFDLPTFSRGELLSAAQRSVEDDIEAVASEAAARLSIAKTNAEERAHLRSHGKLPQPPFGDLAHLGGPIRLDGVYAPQPARRASDPASNLELA